MSRLAALACAVALGGGCQEPPVREWTPADHGQPKPRPGSETRTAPAEDSAPVSPEEAEARATLALWNVTCASCHARDGKGGGPGLPPGAKVPDLTDAAFIATRTNDQLIASIRDGKGMMPAFGPQLGPAGVSAMLAHVRSLSAAPAPQGAPAQADAPAQPDAPAP